MTSAPVSFIVFCSPTDMAASSGISTSAVYVAAGNLSVSNRYLRILSLRISIPLAMLFRPTTISALPVLSSMLPVRLEKLIVSAIASFLILTKLKLELSAFSSIAFTAPSCSKSIAAHNNCFIIHSSLNPITDGPQASSKLYILLSKRQGLGRDLRAQALFR